MQNDPAASNAEQRRYWNEKGGPTWVANEEMYDEELAPLGRIAIGRANVALGERALHLFSASRSAIRNEGHARATRPARTRECRARGP